MIIRDIYFHSLANTGSNTFALTISNSNPFRKVVEITSGYPGVTTGDETVLNRHKPEPCIFKGHNLYGLVEKAGLDDKYITLLRDPKERVISDFYWNRRLIERGRGTKFTYLEDIEAFSNFVIACEHLNFYIHHLSHINYSNNSTFDINECSSISNTIALKWAKESLRSKFLDIAITEEFDRSLFKLADKVGLRSIFNWSAARHSKTPGRPTFAELPTYIQQQIVNKTKDDNELYLEQREEFESTAAPINNNILFINYANFNNYTQPIDSSDHTFNPTRFEKSLLPLKNELKIICVGAGNALEQMLKTNTFNRFQILGIYDKYNHGKTLSGIKIKKMDDMELNNVEVIIITSTRFYNEIRNSILFTAFKYRSNALII